MDGAPRGAGVDAEDARWLQIVCSVLCRLVLLFAASSTNVTCLRVHDIALMYYCHAFKRQTARTLQVYFTQLHSNENSQTLVRWRPPVRLARRPQPHTPWDDAVGTC